MSSIQSKRGRVLFAVATLAVLVGLGAGAYAIRSTNAESKAAAAPFKAAPQALPVPVAVIEEREVVTWDEFSGRLEAVERVDVRSRAAGAVKSVHFIEGALVKRGDLLVTIDPDPYAAEVDRAKAQLVAAQARLSYAKIERERAERLWERAFHRAHPGRRAAERRAGSRCERARHAGCAAVGAASTSATPKCGRRYRAASASSR